MVQYDLSEINHSLWKKPDKALISFLVYLCGSQNQLPIPYYHH